ncbi:MAG: hypothetical protein NTY77_09820 [Elusimicrobia bacterium]|nr:hypothetical protein [Elusimicrobiota bacterium]
MAEEVCAKCRKSIAQAPKRYRCTSCGALFCASCMDRHCLFCRAAVVQTAPGR